MPARRPITIAIVLAVIAGSADGAFAQTAAGPSLIPEAIGGPEKWTSPEGITSSLQIMLLLTVVSLAPAILLMTTSFASSW
jgi:flagellar biosynthesis protein FliP